MELLLEVLSVLHPGADRMTEEPGLHSVIRSGDEMRRKVAKWLPGALISTLWLMHSAETSTHTLEKVGRNTFLSCYRY